MKITKIAASIISLGLAGAPSAHATNGMNLEGYGPIASAMGGASMAYDNGTAAVMNNPATLGLMKEGSSRFDAAIGGLFPDVSSSMTSMPTADSSATAFYMPAMGYARKTNKLTLGVGVFSQGGMGTEYSGTSFMSAGSGKTTRSEVGVGRFIVPVAYELNDQVTIGGSLDYVWAGMDLKMALSGGQFGDMVSSMGGTQTYGAASGSMVSGFVGAVTAGMMNPSNPMNWGYFDFSDSSRFTGEAKGAGFAEKIGVTFKLNPQLTIGASYHTKTAMGDLETSNATVSFNANMDDNLLAGTWDGGSTGSAAGTYTAATIPVTGKISVRDFQWPDTYGFGVAYQANDQLMVAVDYKRIGWAKVMKDFKMTFTADSTQANPLAGGFAGTTLDATMYQNWDDQNVFELGGAYKVNPALTVRAGVNLANNPVPDKYMNPLFPAIAKNHITGGIGYVLSSASNIDVSFAYVPKSSATNGSGVTVDFGGFGSQFVYSYQY